MSIQPETLVVEVNEAERVTALLYSPQKNASGNTIVLGHGAGANQLSGFMTLFAEGLAERQVHAVTFNFLYAEQRRRSPDPGARLEACYRAVIEKVRQHRKVRDSRLWLGGKSMGGRIASQVAASGVIDDAGWLAGLIFLGYPLHPPGKPDQLRDKHLKDVAAPMLFVQGTRDSFGTPAEIEAVIKRSRLNATVYPVDGGDHSFKVPKSAGVTQENVYASVMDRIVEWIGGI